MRQAHGAARRKGGRGPCGRHVPLQSVSGFPSWSHFPSGQSMHDLAPTQPGQDLPQVVSVVDEYVFVVCDVWPSGHHGQLVAAVFGCHFWCWHGLHGVVASLSWSYMPGLHAWL